MAFLTKISIIYILCISLCFYILTYQQAASNLFQKAFTMLSLSPLQISKLIDNLKETNPYFVYIFGSASRNELRIDSDIDLAVYCQQTLNPLFMFELKEKLASQLNRDIDLIDLRQANDVIRVQVISTGCIVQSFDDQVLYDCQIRWLKQYAMLNDERRPILARIKKEGSIYG
mgnify:CR=1 FL=1